MNGIEFATERDIEKIANCHRVAFPGSLSTALGLQYVKVMLRWYLSTENTFLFFIDEDDLCVGYCGGMIRSKPGMGSASSMAQFSFNQAVRSFLVRPWLILHRELRAKYLFVGRNLWMRFKKLTMGNVVVKVSSDVVFEPYVALVVIGVMSNAQGKGYGSKLLQEFERKTIDLGYKKMLLTVISSNIQAIKSYKRNGWIVTRVDGKSTSMEKIIQ